jgi:hypothetical protein
VCVAKPETAGLRRKSLLHISRAETFKDFLHLKRNKSSKSLKVGKSFVSAVTNKSLRSADSLEDDDKRTPII